MENSKLKAGARYGFVALATFLATKFFGGCGICYGHMLGGLIALGIALFLGTKGKLTKAGIKTVGGFTFVGILAIVASLFHLANHPIEIVDEATGEGDEVEIVVEDESKNESLEDTLNNIINKNNNGGYNRGYCNPEEKIETKETITETIDKNNVSIETEEPTNTVVIEGNDDAQKEADEAVKKAEEDPALDSHVSDHGIVVIDDNEDFVEDKEDNTKEPEIDVNDNDVVVEELVSDQEDPSIEESIKNDTEEKELVIEDNATDDELADLFYKDSEVKAEETVEVKAEEVAPQAVVEEEVVDSVVVPTVEEEIEIENTQVVEVVEPVEEEVVIESEPVVETTPVVEEKVDEIKVTAIDGYEGFINSDIQFKVAGENVKVYGLEGTNSTFANGMLTINADEATVVSVVLDNGVSTISFDVTINGFVG